MPVTSFHKDTGRWLTTSQGFEPGTECTLSIGHPLMGGEFTTYRLGGVVAYNERGEPLFDLNEAEIKMDWGDDAPWYPRDLLARIREELPTPGFTLGGVRYRYGSFGNYHVESHRDREPWRPLREYTA